MMRYVHCYQALCCVFITIEAPQARSLTAYLRLSDVHHRHLGSADVGTKQSKGHQSSGANGEALHQRKKRGNAVSNSCTGKGAWRQG